MLDDTRQWKKVVRARMRAFQKGAFSGLKEDDKALKITNLLFVFLQINIIKR